jgi:ketosteroid isomerase-like protein
MMRAGFAAFSRGDWDSTLDLVDPEVEWHLTFRLPDLPPGKTVFTGHDEVRQLWEARAFETEQEALEAAGVADRG